MDAPFELDESSDESSFGFDSDYYYVLEEQKKQEKKLAKNIIQGLPYENFASQEKDFYKNTYPTDEEGVPNLISAIQVYDNWWMAQLALKLGVSYKNCYLQDQW